MFAVTGLHTPPVMSYGCIGEGVSEPLPSFTLAAHGSNDCEDRLLVLGMGVDDVSPCAHIGDGEGLALFAEALPVSLLLKDVVYLRGVLLETSLGMCPSETATLVLLGPSDA